MNSNSVNKKSKLERFRQYVRIIIFGTNTFAGKIFDVVLLTLIVLSVLFVMLESVQEIDAKYHGLFYISEWIITIFFTLEYILRIFSSREKKRYILSFYGIIDLLAILPVYISTFITGTHFISVIRSLRLLRLFKVLNLVHFAKQSHYLKLALHASRTKIIIFIYFVLVVCIILGTVMYSIEGKESGFTSIPRSIYWCIVTLTTVGYGDIAPQTALGQFIASFIMILGYGIIAVPTGIVTSELTKEVSKEANVSVKCNQCGSKNHKNGANYCYNCGSEI
ncbi:MAG: ion transporter [Flavobacteriales bacterium]|nr:ion transporter [Flavobacteriales bacterium]